MSNLTEQVRPILQRVFESMAGVKTYWREQPQQFAGAGQFTGVGAVSPTPGVAGVQATIKITEVEDAEGEDWTVAVRDSNAESGWVFENRGTRNLSVSLRVWSWSQQDSTHPHSFIDRVRTKLKYEDGPEKQLLQDNNIVWVTSNSAVVLDRVEDGRSLSEVNLDMRFRCSPETLTREGSVIESVEIEGIYGGGRLPRLDNIVFSPPRATSWTPYKAKSPLVWWAAEDGLEGPEKAWRDRISSHLLVPKGAGGVGNVTYSKKMVTTGDQSYLATDSVIPHDDAKSQYIWAYARVNSVVDTLAVYLSFFHTSPGPWMLLAKEDGVDLRCVIRPGDELLDSSFFGDPVTPPGRKVLVGVYIYRVKLPGGTIERRARLDVDGIEGPTIVFETDTVRSGLQVGSWGGTNNGSGSWLTEMDVFDVGIAEGEDIRAKLLGYVKYQYK